MNGFASHGLDEDAFGEKKGSIVKSFDAFPKAKPEYITRTSGGGKWTVVMLVISFLLVLSEFRRWWGGFETHTFAVEKGVGHNLQINLDTVVKMNCDDIHINVQDAAGDRVLASMMLQRDPTNWNQWVDGQGIHTLGKDDNGRVITGAGYHEPHDEGFGEEHVHDIISMAGKRARFAKTPKLRRSRGDSCRVYGSLSVNKVQGDFHITARGHGYQEFGASGHLDHNIFNFSHIVSELSFGQFYPSLHNPLDRTVASTPNHFHKFQYFVSVVPTIYSVKDAYSTRVVNTNQYAVTEQSHIIGERAIPGIFFKYDIEPMLLTVEESRESFLRFVVKVVNVLSGVLVAGHWGFTLTEWAISVWGKRMRRSEGVLHGRSNERYD